MHAKIIILGAGQVGRTVAEIMAIEHNDITVVDREPCVLGELQQRLDIRTVTGSASYPSVLVRAGIEDADLVFAVTNDDETNMIACQIAYNLYQTPKRLARVRSAEYVNQPRLFRNDAMSVTYLINPELMVTNTIRRLVENPGTFDIADFVGGKVCMAATRVRADTTLVNQRLGALGRLIGQNVASVVAAYRDGKALPIGDDLEIRAGDEIYFLTRAADVRSVTESFHGNGRPNQRIVIAGGGNIGLHLARLLEPRHHVKVIERSKDRCRHLAESLRRTVVLNGDVTDTDLLQSEGIENTDVFCAVTHEERTNIVSAMLAKQLGTRTTFAVVNSFSHCLLAEQSSIDVALTPAELTIGALLTHVRRGDIATVRAFRKGEAEALEIIARGDAATSRAVGRAVGSLPLPSGALIGAIWRADALMFPTADTVIESNDRVLIVLSDKTALAEVERLFEVLITYL